jgi:hypothetical protein
MATKRRVFQTLKSSANYDIADIPCSLGISEVVGGISEGPFHNLSGMSISPNTFFSLNSNLSLN